MMKRMASGKGKTVLVLNESGELVRAYRAYILRTQRLAALQAAVSTALDPKSKEVLRSLMVEFIKQQSVECDRLLSGTIVTLNYVLQTRTEIPKEMYEIMSLASNLSAQVQELSLKVARPVIRNCHDIIMFSPEPYISDDTAPLRWIPDVDLGDDQRSGPRGGVMIVESHVNKSGWIGPICGYDLVLDFPSISSHKFYAIYFDEYGVDFDRGFLEMPVPVKRYDFGIFSGQLVGFGTVSKFDRYMLPFQSVFVPSDAYISSSTSLSGGGFAP